MTQPPCGLSVGLSRSVFGVAVVGRTPAPLACSPRVGPPFGAIGRCLTLPASG